jgi:hypothetical protein
MALSEEYEPQFVAFIDILGFTSMVDKIDSDERVFDQIININSIIEASISEAATLVGGILDVDIRWTAFPDSIVISVPATKSRTVVFTPRLIRYKRFAKLF